MRVGIILQARMSSARLPGKVMREIAGKPMLWHIIERLRKAGQSDELVVATSTNIKDKEVIELAKNCGVRCFIGSEEDVLDRLYQAAKEFHLKHIVRATGDNPLVDPEEADRLISLHLKTAADYSSNKAEVNSGLPVGVGVEIFSFAALERSWFEGKDRDHREHVDEYILQNRSSFNLQVLQAPKNKLAPHLKLTVDTEEDLNFIIEIYRRFYRPGQIIAVEEVIRYLTEESGITKKGKGFTLP